MNSFVSNAANIQRGLRCAGTRRLFLPFLLAFAVLPLASCRKKTDTAAEQKTGPHVKWEFKSAASALSHPAIGADGTIYVGTNSSLQAVSPEGKLLWEARLGAAGTPVVSDDGTIYLDTWHGLMFGVSKEGQLIWRPGYGLSAFGAPPALGADTTLYYMNNVADIYAFQPKRSEEKLWALETFREGMLGTSMVLPGTARPDGLLRRAAPALTSNDSVILPRQNFLYSISTRGSPEWELQLTWGIWTTPAWRIRFDASVWLWPYDFGLNPEVVSSAALAGRVFAYEV